MYLDHTFAHKTFAHFFGLSRHLDRTFAQWIDSAKVKSKSEVTHCNLVVSLAKASQRDHEYTLPVLLITL